jgi:hypothetical protein
MSLGGCGQALSRGMRERGLKGFTEGEAHAVWTWAHQTRVANAILEMALMGLINIALRDDGQLTFKGTVDPDRAAQLLMKTAANQKDAAQREEDDHG